MEISPRSPRENAELTKTSKESDTNSVIDRSTVQPITSTISEHPDATAVKAKTLDEEDDCLSSCLVNIGCGIGSFCLAFVALFAKALSCLCTPFSMLYKWFKR